MDKWITKNQATIFRISAVIFIFAAVIISKFTNTGSLIACAIYVILVVSILTSLSKMQAKYH